MSEDSSKSSTGLMTKLSVMLFLQFFIWGAWYISIPKYVGGFEYMGESIYYCYGAIPLAAMIAPFFLGLVADRFFNTEKILGLLFVLSGVTMFLLPHIANLEGDVVNIAASGAAENLALKVNFMGMSGFKHEFFNNVILAHSLLYMPTLALTASLCFHHLPKGSVEFPKVRVWGTFGWIFGGLALILFNSTAADGSRIAGESSEYQFYLAGIAAILLGLFSFFGLPKTVAPKKGEKADISSLLFVDVWREFKNSSFAVFVVCSFLLCIPLQAYYVYLQTQMGTQGFTNIPSWKNAGTWLEAIMMFSMPFFFIKLGIKKMIAIGIGAWIVRYALFPLAAGFGVMEGGIQFGHGGFLLILGGVLLHGICYDFFFVSGQVYVDQVTDRKIRGQAQSMIIFFTQGLGMYVGDLINKELFMSTFKVDNMGAAYGAASKAENLGLWANFWWPLCIFAGIILVIFLVAFKHKDKEDAEFSH
jgi:nucleoside transporter